MDQQPDGTGFEGTGIIPFAIVALFTLVMLPVVGGELTGAAGITAIVLTVATGIGVVMAPWQRLSRAWRYIPPLAYLLVVALVREAAEGSGYVFVPLILLPVLWVALHGTRAELAAMLLAALAALAVPEALFDHPMRDSGLIALVVALAALMGFAIQSLVRSLIVGEAAARSSERALAIATRAIREATASAHPRPAICEAACMASGADVAILVEPDEESGDIVATASAGIDDVALRITPGREPSGAVIALVSGERHFVADATSDNTVNQRVVASTGAASILFEPVLSGEDVVGVLAVCWRHPVADENQPGAATVRLLAAEAAAIIERGELMQSLARLARTDPLTGLLNRRSWDEILASEVTRAGRTGRPFAVLMIDVDDLKSVNDRGGHPAGDRLLKAAASAFRAVLREGDNVARLGGDEFGVLLPECDPDLAREIGARMTESMPMGTSCSVGVGSYEDGDDVAAVTARADDALYRAKSLDSGEPPI
ncbi:MAG: diguanylate cyclase [Solirubrobacterales bacterium]|nr:diguanylate cyclase [Solirubrobacterales bacterium]MCB8970742.1 diguanylate cyclase [Thermoleophilales bacterium]